jgi:hypothetical protein
MLVREYLNQQAGAADEQQRGLEGWSVESTVNPHVQQDLFDRACSFPIIALHPATFLRTRAPQWTNIPICERSYPCN